MKSQHWLLAALPMFAVGSIAWAHALEEFRLVASDAQPGGEFGAAVAVHTNTIVVGAPGTNTLGTNAGAAYVFFYDGNTYAEQDKLLATGGLGGDRFGISVAVHGDTVIVGAPGDDTNGNVAGAAYVFVRSGSTWSQQAKLLATGGGVGDQLGTSVAVSGDTAVIGAARPDGTGSAYVFVRSGTSWSQQAQLTASDGIAGNGFGISVSVEGDLAVVGAHHQNGLVADSGAAYVYSRSGTVWSQDQKIQAADGVTGALFGQSCALSATGNEFGDEVIAIGAPGDTENGADAGATYRYNDGTGSWTQAAKRLGTLGDHRGTSVDVNYDFISTGSPYYDYTGKVDCGGLWLSDVAITTGVAQLFVAAVVQNDGHHGMSTAIDDCWVVGGAPDVGEAGLEPGVVYVFEVLSGSGNIVNGTNVNPELMTTTAGPNIGKLWHVEINTTPVPAADMTYVLVHTSFLPTPRMTKWGELLVDLASPKIMASIVAGTGIVEHVAPIPNDPFSVGVRYAAQGALFQQFTPPDLDGITMPFRLLRFTNGEELQIGCYGQ